MDKLKKRYMILHVLVLMYIDTCLYGSKENSKAGRRVLDVKEDDSFDEHWDKFKKRYVVSLTLYLMYVDMYLCSDKEISKAGRRALNVKGDDISDEQVKKKCVSVDNPLYICIDICFSHVRAKGKGIAKDASGDEGGGSDQFDKFKKRYGQIRHLRMMG